MSKYLCPYCNKGINGSQIDFLEHFQIDHNLKIYTVEELFSYLKDDGIRLKVIKC